MFMLVGKFVFVFVRLHYCIIINTELENVVDRVYRVKIKHKNCCSSSSSSGVESIEIESSKSNVNSFKIEMK